MTGRNLPARYAAAVQKGRAIARQEGVRYDETPAWRANERTVEAVWKEARAAGHSVAELADAAANEGDD
ncbi:hypothetical protein AB0F46_18665 [Streptomyces sp. NPDC026665]|uniref:hypothetical protein n=1 Tax=Streptomyces sp. NPDC026665 TaxID=3154798 RepID=UPI003403ED76